MKPTLAILLISGNMLLDMGTCSSLGRDRGQYVSWEGVNVVAHGFLQLGQGLKEHVEKTKSQMIEISAKLKAFNGTLIDLGRQIRSLHEVQEALRTTAQEMVERQNAVVNMSAEVQARAEQLMTERWRIHSRLDKLENKMDGMLQRQSLNLDKCTNNTRDANFIQCLMDKQNKQISVLMKRVRQQQEELEKHNMHIEALQDKVKESREKLVVRLRHQGISLKDDAKEVTFRTEFARNCHELFLKGERDSGVYTIKTISSEPLDVFCQMAGEVGWTVIQRRKDGSQNFDQLWEAYQKGFGSLNGEFWLGLDNIHMLTKQREHTLQVELSDWTGETHSFQYLFQLGGEESNYTLYLPRSSSEGGFSPGPSGLSFSTTDRDNDLSTNVNCAKQLSGGSWFSNCGQTNLNGRYATKTELHLRTQPRKQLIFWKCPEDHCTKDCSSNS